ncbi:MAG: PDZ domain-containing protein [Planctomycetes bacterium]|nr:PDZ domain-containing protein [Planctomycetota bacterium]
MRKGILLFVIFLCWSCDQGDTAMSVDLAKLHKEIDDVKQSDISRKIKSAKEKVYPALVFIRVVVQDLRGGMEYKVQSQGSGTVISEDGLVLTNFHVAGDSVRILCVLSNKEEVSADFVAGDYQTDLALIRLNLNEMKDKSSLHHAKLGDSKKLEVGDYVLAMGAPLGLARSVTLGIVSNTERVLGAVPDNRGRMVGIYSNWIQHDATIAPGNSGGPLVNLDGEIIGINTRAIRNTEGLSLSVPADTAKEIVDKLIVHKKVQRSFFGFTIQRNLKSRTEDGALVNYVYPSTPAADAGLKAGDLITKINGEKISVNFDEDLHPALNLLVSLDVGKEHEFTVNKNGKTEVIKIKSVGEEEQIGRERELKHLGMMIRELTTPIVLARQLSQKKGVLVTFVGQGSPCLTAAPIIMPNDIIISMDNKAIDNYDTFINIYEEIIKNKKKEVLIEFERFNGAYVTLVKLLTKKQLKQRAQNYGVSMVRRSWIGCVLQPFSDELGQQIYADKNISGVRIARVYDDSPAVQAGLKVNDIILSVDGNRVNAQNDQALNGFIEMLRSKPADSEVEFEVFRSSKKKNIKVRFEYEPASYNDAETCEDKSYGISARDLVFYDRINFHLGNNESGVLITQVQSGGWAEFSKLPVNSIIQRIDDREIKNVQDFKDVMKKLSEDRNKTTTFYVLMSGIGSFIEVETDWDKIQ